MIKPEIAHDRMMQNRLINNKWDMAQMSLKQQIYDGYVEISKDRNFPNTVIFDATQPMEIVFKSVFKLIQDKIKQHYGI
jgi:thymidylate kinase